MTHEELALRAGDAYQAVRELNHSTMSAVLPAPVVYDLLGELRPVGSALDQLARQLGVGLARSLDRYDVYDNSRDPAASVAMAVHALRVAARHADRLATALAAAQVAISQQGYHQTNPDTDTTAAAAAEANEAGETGSRS